MTEDVETVERVTGTGVPVRGNDIDTDQIIPARFLKVVTFDGLGQFVFQDVRFTDDDGVVKEDQRSSVSSETDVSETPEEQRDDGGEAARVKDHPFNEDRFRDASILVVNANFGCGSSREHAPQALKRWGIDAIVGESFAEIFAGNCLALGVPTVTASAEEIEALQDFVDENPDAEIDVDVADETVTYGDTELDATVDDAQRRALVEGVWDTTALMKSNAETVAETAASLPYIEAGADAEGDA
jgi:3-isopropylmalate/(R)-2-methylmalate dehydratase small subunit